MDGNSAGIIDVADGLMRVTLDACVPYFPLLAWVLIPAYVLSQYRIRHVLFLFKAHKHTHSR